MSKVVLKKTIDVTEVNLMPGEPAVCLGNGGQEFECCCDECDYFLLCFPELSRVVEGADPKRFYQNKN